MAKLQINKLTTTGEKAEIAARKFLEKKGYKFIGKNIKYKFGEIDLIMLDQTTYIFIEIKYRSSMSYGGSLLAISNKQIKRLVLSANYYMQKNKINCPARFDFIGYDNEKISWIKNAFN